MVGKDDTDAVVCWRRVAAIESLMRQFAESGLAPARALASDIEPASDTDSDSVSVKLTLAPLE